MSESQSHKRAKSKAPGETEVKILCGKRLDSATLKTATEVERNPQNIPKAVKRLKDSGRDRKVIQVPQNLMDDAVEAMKNQGVSGTVKNLSDTKRISVRKKRQSTIEQQIDQLVYQLYGLTEEEIAIVEGKNT